MDRHGNRTAALQLFDRSNDANDTGGFIDNHRLSDGIAHRSGLRLRFLAPDGAGQERGDVSERRGDITHADDPERAGKGRPEAELVYGLVQAGARRKDVSGIGRLADPAEVVAPATQPDPAVALEAAMRSAR